MINVFHVGLLAMLLTLTAGAMAQDLTDIDTIETIANGGEIDRALNLLEDRINADPNDVEARFFKGLLQMQQNDLEAARETFEAITRDFPRLPEAFNNLAAIYVSQGEYEYARVALQSAVANAPEYSAAQANLGDLHSKMALDAYRRALAIDPNDEASEAKLEFLERMFSPGG